MPTLLSINKVTKIASVGLQKKAIHRNERCECHIAAFVATFHIVLLPIIFLRKVRYIY